MFKRNSIFFILALLMFLAVSGAAAAEDVITDLNLTDSADDLKLACDINDDEMGMDDNSALADGLKEDGAQSREFDVRVGSTFDDDMSAVQAEFIPSELFPEYYQGDVLIIPVRDNSSFIDAPVTLRAYQNGTLAGSFEFSSYKGWAVNITEGNYIFAFSVESPEFEVAPLNATVLIHKNELPNIEITIENATYPDKFCVNLTSNHDGTLEVHLDDSYEMSFDAVSGKTIQTSFEWIHAGNHTLTATIFPSRYGFDSRTFVKNFTVSKRPTSITLYVNDSTEDDNFRVYMVASETGDVNVTVAGRSLMTFVSAGRMGQVSFGYLEWGLHNVTASFSAGDDYENSSATKAVRIYSVIHDWDVEISDLKDNAGEIPISLPGDATGNITFEIAGHTYCADIAEGMAYVRLNSNLTDGDYPYLLTYPGNERYARSAVSGTVYVYDKRDVEINVSDVEIVVGDIAVVEITISNGTRGMLWVNGIDVPVLNGKADYKFEDLAVGKYTFTIRFDGDRRFNPCVTTVNVTVKPNPTIAAGNLAVQYTSGKYYTINVYLAKDVPADNEKVVITVAGKPFKTLTVKNGAASFKVSEAPGTYRMTISSMGVSIVKTLTVSHIVTLKNVKVKKSAKKIVLQATLSKVNGKYLKNKKITFKFNGKKYTAKTNNKGVAKLTIKNSKSGKNSYNFAKLKVGKKVTYQATYLKDTVKKTTNVKK